MTDAARTALDLLAARGATLGANDDAFVRRVYARGLEPYRRRVAQWGLAGLGPVLDAGCGFGQWSLALARDNARVHAVDPSAERTAFTGAMAARLGLDGLRMARGTAQALPYADASFDGVLCYGVLCTTPWREALAELCRVLAPGGLLYVNANAMGWFNFLWDTRHNEAADYDPRWHAAKALHNAWDYDKHGSPPEPGTQVLIEPGALRAELERLGMADVRQGEEGTLRAPGWQGEPDPPFFLGSYRGQPGIYELTARKG